MADQLERRLRNLPFGDEAAALDLARDLARAGRLGDDELETIALMVDGPSDEFLAAVDAILTGAPDA